MAESFSVCASISGEEGTRGAGKGKVRLQIAEGTSVPYGDSATQADIFEPVQVSPAASATSTIDLTAITAIGPTESSNGATVTLAAVEYIIVQADAANGSTVTVGEGASNGLDILGGGDVTIAAGGVALIPGPFTVDGTNKTLDVVNNDGSAAATINLAFLGR